MQPRSRSYRGACASTPTSETHSTAGGSESDLSRKSNSPVAPRAIDCSSGTDEVRTSSFVLPIRLPLFREGPGALDVIQALPVLLVSRIDLPHCGFQT